MVTYSINDLFTDICAKTELSLKNDVCFKGGIKEYPFHRELVEPLCLNFYPCTIQEIKRQFALLTQNSAKSFIYKFPSVLLVHPVPIRYMGAELTARCNIVIVARTQPELSTYGKDKRIMETLLRPIAKHLTDNITKHRRVISGEGLEYEYTEYYTVNEEEKRLSTSIYGAEVDVIELSDLKLNLINC